jgi:hypothetical protein
VGWSQDSDSERPNRLRGARKVRGQAALPSESRGQGIQPLPDKVQKQPRHRFEGGRWRGAEEGNRYGWTEAEHEAVDGGDEAKQLGNGFVRVII